MLYIQVILNLTRAADKFYKTDFSRLAEIGKREF